MVGKVDSNGEAEGRWVGEEKGVKRFWGKKRGTKRVVEGLGVFNGGGRKEMV